MALKHILLGTISLLGPRSGYELHKVLMELGRPKLPQIYRCLRELNEEGHVKYSRVHAHKDPTKNIYAVTPSGQKILKEWLKQKDDVKPILEPMIHKIWFSRVVDRSIILDDLKAFIIQRKSEIQFYKKMIKMYAETITSSRISTNCLDRYYVSQALGYMIARGKSDVKWANKTIKEISATDTDALKNTYAK